MLSNNNENKKNIELWENLGRTNPFWGVLTKKQKDWNKNKFYSTSQNDISALLSLLKSLDYQPKIKNVLDFGCGVGRLTKSLSKLYENIIAVDVSLGMLKTAIENDINSINTTFIYYNSQKLSFIKDNKIDLIISFITFQHIIPDMQIKYLEDFSRILTNNGLIVLQLVHGFNNNFKGVLLKIFGNSLLKLSQKLKYNLNYPIKIYPINKKRFLEQLKLNNLKIVSKTISYHTGNSFQSYIYLIRKNENTYFHNIKH